MAAATAAGPASSMWGTSLRQRLRLMPFFLAVCVADALSVMVRRRAAPHEPSPPGISVLIPEREAPALLEEAIAAVETALSHLAEPHEIVVVVNGAPASMYSVLSANYPAIRFVFHDAPLGFASAVHMGLAHVRHPWTLLLNNDMRVAPDAVAALAAQRAPDVFAVGAQIFQRSADGRREETGFTDWYVDGNGVHLFHAPVTRDAVTPHLCASGGAALFRTDVLRRYVHESLAYDPFYWEDVEWSVRAWRDGWRVLFAPQARAEHRHRATTARFYAAAELERIVERNRWLFDARQGITHESASWLMRRICDLPYSSQRELSSPAIARTVLTQRVHARRAPQPSVPPVLWTRECDSTRLPDASYSYQLRHGAGAKNPTLLIVTPFAAFPPRHGGARRVTELVRVLRADYDIVLVSDEAHLYDARSFAYFDNLAAVHLVERREASESVASSEMDVRMRAHAHAGLVKIVRDAIRIHRPVLVQIEHAELSGLVAQRKHGERWVLGLHDACRAGDFTSPRAFESFERELLGAFDAVTVCSMEDAALVRHRNVVCVPNGSTVMLQDYRPSQGRRLLFVGPFRYAPNGIAISRFLADAYARIRAAVPDVELLVLGGDEAIAATAHDPLFRQPAVTVLGHRDDVPRLLTACTITINPQMGIRGSAVKLVESLSAGRVCVSTEEGARGFDAQGFPALVTVPDVAAMHAPIIQLLLDADERHRREVPDTQRLAPYQWSSCARIQAGLYDCLLNGAQERA